MTRSLPIGWKEKRLGEVGLTQTGYTPSKSDSQNYGNYIPFIRPAELNVDSNGGIEYDSEIKLSEIGLKKTRLIKANSVLMCCIGSVGKTGFTDRDVTCNQQINTLTPNSDLFPKFAYYALISPSFQEKTIKIANSAKATLAIISKGKWENLSIPVPPLEEQKRIVEKLDKIFANIDKAKEQTTQNLKNAQEVFESYANSLLFNIKNSIKTTIGKECSLMTGGTPNSKNELYYQNGNIKWLVSGDVHQGIIYDCVGRITEMGYNNSNAKFLPVDSVLIALNGQGKTRGTVALLKTKATCNQSIVSIKPNDDNKLLAEFLYKNLQARYMEIRRMTGDDGNDRRGLNMPLIRSIRIEIPSNIQEQKK